MSLSKIELEIELEKVKNEFEAFKKRVIEVARARAEEHSWCGVVDDALAEIGLNPHRSATLDLSISLTVDSLPMTNSEIEDWEPHFSGDFEREFQKFAEEFFAKVVKDRESSLEPSVSGVSLEVNDCNKD